MRARHYPLKLRRNLPLLAFFLAVGALGAIRENHFVTDIPWAPSFEAGLAQARQSHKPLLLSFHSPGCGWCEKMDAETFTDPQVLEQARGYVCVRLDSDVDAAVAERYHVLDYPTTVIADSHGQQQTLFTGYVPPAKFAAILRDMRSALAR